MFGNGCPKDIHQFGRSRAALVTPFGAGIHMQACRSLLSLIDTPGASTRTSLSFFEWRADVQRIRATRAVPVSLSMESAPREKPKSGTTVEHRVTPTPAHNILFHSSPPLPNSSLTGVVQRRRPFPKPHSSSGSRRFGSPTDGAAQ